MVTFKTTPIDVRTLNGFFEASWLFKRNGTYYMAYAANTAGPTSECTEAVYYACIAYGTSPSPLGPWTYRGVILDPVSSTTSHPGIVEYKGKWYLVYHTGRRAERRSLSPLGRDRSPRVGRRCHSAAHQESRADGRSAGRHHADREHRVARAHLGVEPTRSHAVLVARGERRQGARVAASARHVGHLVAQQSAATVDHVSVGAAGNAQRIEPSLLGRSRRRVGSRRRAAEGVAPRVLGRFHVGSGRSEGAVYEHPRRRQQSRILSGDDTMPARGVRRVNRWDVLCRGGAAGMGGLLDARATTAQAVGESGRDAELLAVIFVHPLSQAQR